MVFSAVTLLFFLLLGSVPSVAALQQSAASSSAADNQPTVASAHERLERGDTAGAISMLEQLRKEQPAAAGLARELGIAYYRSGKLVEAEREFAAAMQEDANDKESVQLRGLTLYRMGQPAAAIPFLERAREWTPNGNADANHVLGLCYLNARRYDDARQAFATEYHVSPDSGAAYLLFAQQLMTANLPEFAVPAAQKALQQSPGIPLAHFLLGEVYLYKAKPDSAIAEFEEERRINPGYARTYERLGDAYIRVGKFQEGQEMLAQALSLDTSSTGPFILMGKALLKRNDPQTAVMYLQHAEKMDPANYTTHTLLGQAYRAMGREADAKQQLETAVKIQSASELKLDAAH